MSLEEEIKQKEFKNPSQRMMINLIYTGNWINSLIGKTLKPYGISLQQYNVLRILKGQYPNPTTVLSITERMLDKMSNASRLVDKLLEKGYVERTPCEADRRKVDIIITEKGLELLNELDDVILEIENKLSEDLSAQELEMINMILDKVRD